VFEDIPAAVGGALQARMQVCGVYDSASQKSVEEMKALCHHYIFDFSELLSPKESSAL
jgi:beta-phosphoglucomutase-like phosphatase (HAD superfamily)